jgi:LPS sulfotransferase NodH
VPVEKRSDESDHLKRPIILIGTGRSGSTLLVRILNAHPDVQFEGETDFLIARLWREVWGNQFWLKSQYSMRHKLRDLTSSRAGDGELPPGNSRCS